MKTIIRLLTPVLLSLTLFAGTAATASAQKECNWKEKIMREKIAFFSTEMDLTPEEAQNFWPVYNSFCDKEDEAHRRIMKTFKELNEAIESGKSSKEISACLDRYLKAREAKRDINTSASEKYLKVLPAEKVAKLYVAEEKFRRSQIQRLHHKHGK